MMTPVHSGEKIQSSHSWLTETMKSFRGKTQQKWVAIACLFVATLNFPDGFSSRVLTRADPAQLPKSEKIWEASLEHTGQNAVQATMEK